MGGRCLIGSVAEAGTGRTPASRSCAIPIRGRLQTLSRQVSCAGSRRTICPRTCSKFSRSSLNCLVQLVAFLVSSGEEGGRPRGFLRRYPIHLSITRIPPTPYLQIAGGT